MSDFMTVDEMKRRFGPEWVLIAEPQTDESLTVQAGRVLHHGLDRDEVCRRSLDFPPGRYAVEFLGTIPDDLVLVL